ncbi:hypothetical protein PHMEG_0005468 [Phytophthora megakarya]|uniref:Transmembrane protein n=1 Tax=Phytophthora megakarya TaxID=4795 RepID=A0A225WSQ9_9STRA|nr:hypothetical protein PHMEG_0005468 [Phytophthora megakarya]
MKSPAADVIYHRYPSENFDPAEKPIPVAIAVDGTATDTEDDHSIRHPSLILDPSPPCRCQAFCSGLGHLLLFHTLNAILGVGGAILVLVLVPVSVGLIPLFGAGIVLFQVSAGVVEELVRLDIRLANVVSKREPKLIKAFGIQGGFSTNNGCDNWCQRLLFLSPKMLLVMLYFATIKLLVGVLSLVAIAWGLVLPVEAICSGGYADVIGWVNYHDHPGVYVIVVLGTWVLGVLCIVFVPKPSVAMTAWACAEDDYADDIRTPKTPPGTCETATELKAVVIQTSTA